MDLIGKKIGKLTIEDYGRQKDKKGHRYYICKCDCGNTKEIRGDHLLNGRTKSCGCINNGSDIIGRKFGRLTVIKGAELYRNKDGRSCGKYYVCKCSCGKEIKVLRSNLINGATQSCGCLNLENQNSVTASRFGVVESTNVNRIYSKKIPKSNTSGFRGVSYHKGKKKWVARIMFQGVSYWLGIYDKKEEAAEIRRLAEEKIYGNFLKWYAEQYPEQWEGMNKKK